MTNRNGDLDGVLWAYSKSIDISELIKSLENAERFGAQTDIPEGARYIRVSTTLAEEIVSILRETFSLR